jgi:hypothetical protein
MKVTNLVDTRVEAGIPEKMTETLLQLPNNVDI